MSRLPTDAAARKRLQLYTYMFGYFADAWLAEVDVARAGNDQHNPGEPLHWAREKSKDQMNAAFNHLFDYGSGQKKDSDGCWHLAKAIWRLKAQLQLDIEAERKDDPRRPSEEADQGTSDQVSPARVLPYAGAERHGQPVSGLQRSGCGGEV